MRSRLDQALVERGLVGSRSLARRLVLAGRVRVDGRTADKPGTQVTDAAALVVKQPPPYVSRGGEKLAPVLEASGVDVRGLVAIDIGASTGGFTDCLLQRGARTVVAVDVGYGQLDWGLRNDPRVEVLERTNARHLTPEDLPSELPGAIEIAVMDVSFISAAKVLPALSRVCADKCDALILVKPQFEAGPDRVETGGVVRDPAVRRATLTGVANAALELGWSVEQALASPLRGPAGNWECFLHLRRGGPPQTAATDPIAALPIPDDRKQRRQQRESTP